MKTIQRISSKRKSKILYLKTKKGGEEVIDLKGKNYKIELKKENKKNYYCFNQIISYLIHIIFA